MIFFTRLLVIVLLLMCKSSFTQSFVTKVSAKKIGKKDVLQIDYVAENASLEQFNLPRLITWNVISGPNFSSSTLQTGKLIKEETIYSIIVQPKSTGRLTVPGATALINNKPTRSNPIVVEVTKADHVAGNQSAPRQAPPVSLLDQLHLEDNPIDKGQFLRKGENAKDKIRNNILIKLDVNKRSCYVGEPILVYYKLCTRLRSQSRVAKQPMFNGCTVIEMTGEDDPVARREVVDGRSYNVYVIRKVQLFPLAEGKLTLPQLSVENKVSFYNVGANYRDLYYNAPGTPVEEQVVTLQNSPVSIDVNPLPPMGQVGASAFSGAVGKFDVEITSDDKVGEAGTNNVQFTIAGEGNLQQVKTPDIKWPSGLEAFDPTEQEQQDKSSFPLMVRKTFSFPFVAGKKGNYVIPPVEFTYFDPHANKYVTRRTASLVLHISQTKKFNLKAFVKPNNEQEFQNRLYIILGAAVLAIIIGLVWYKERNKTPQPLPKVVPVKTEKMIQPETVKTIDPSQYIFDIKDLQPENNNATFYKELFTKIRLYIQAKYNVDAHEVTNYVRQRMKEDFTFDQLNTLLQNCNLGMYTPAFTIEEAMDHRLLAIDILNKLEKA